MLEIDVKNDIENENDVFCWFDEEPKVFSLQTVKDIIANNPNEDEIKLNIHCRGGSVEEGLAIYDYLRSSGKTIYSNIEGGCHSMAVVLLLAAPKENRTANPNCSAMIHKVSTFAFGVATIDELESTLDSLKKSTEKILDIYADRTGKDKEELRTIMNEQKERTAQELLDYGFISKINTYNTNKKESKNNIINKKQNKKMGEKKKGTIKNIVNDFISRIDNAINGTVMNYDFPDKDGNVMFSTTEKGADDDTLAEGDKATPDGTFELANDTSELKAGSVIVIENGEITKITPKEDEPASDDEGNNDLEKENEELKAENKNLKGLLNESKEIILDLKKNTKSNYEPPQRKRTTPLPQNLANKEEGSFTKEDVREAMNFRQKRARKEDNE